MSTEKSVIKAAAIYEVGASVDDKLEAARKEQQQLLGQRAAFSAGHRMVLQLHQAVDAEIVDGKLDLTQAELAKKWVTRASAVLQNMGLKAEASTLTTQGKVEALESVVVDLKRRHHTEMERVNALPPPEQSLASRLEGEHPGPPLKEARAQEPIPESVPEVEAPPPPARIKRKYTKHK